MPSPHTLRGASSATPANRRLIVSAALGHATAVLGDAARAELIALAAVRRSGFSHTDTLAHARHLSISQMRNAPELNTDDRAKPELREFAQQLAMTRKPLERSIMDLSQRHALSPHALGRALGVKASEAEKIVERTCAAWDHDLDPALMAWLGPASCDALARLLSEHHLWPRANDSAVVGSIDSTGPVPIVTDGKIVTDKKADKKADKMTGDVDETASAIARHPSTVDQRDHPTVAAFVGAAPKVAEHAVDCDRCGTRLQNLNGVRDVLSQVPLPDPSVELLRAMRPYKKRPAFRNPPSIAPRRFDLQRFRTTTTAILGIVVLTAIGALLLQMHNDDEPTQNSRVDDLVKNTQGQLLSPSATSITAQRPQVDITNSGNTPMLWHIDATATWLEAQPNNGQLAPGQTITIMLLESPRQTVPVETTMELVGSDESKQLIRYSTTGKSDTTSSIRTQAGTPSKPVKLY